MKVLLTGARGQLGRELNKVFSQTHQIKSVDKEELDITNTSKAQNFITRINPDLIIHCAALTDVDGCERNPDQAYKVNALGTQNLVTTAQQVDAEFVYISTDFVFAGEKETPYLEFDDPAPQNVYGKSKLAGEEYVKSLLNKYYIVRTSWLCGPGKNFVKTMLNLARERKYLEVVHDQIGTPTFTHDLAKAILKLVKSKLYGCYHISNNGSCSWYEFANEIFKLKEIDIEVEPITSDKLNRPAKRPAYSVLRNFALETQRIYVMRKWEEALKEYLKTI